MSFLVRVLLRVQKERSAVTSAITELFQLLNAIWKHYLRVWRLAFARAIGRFNARHCGRCICFLVIQIRGRFKELTWHDLSVFVRWLDPQGVICIMPVWWPVPCQSAHPSNLWKQKRINNIQSIAEASRLGHGRGIMDKRFSSASAWVRERQGNKQCQSLSGWLLNGGITQYPG
jgi:hypothetical protein